MGGLRGRGEGVTEARRRTGGEKEVRDGEVKELFIHKVFWLTHTLGKFTRLRCRWDRMAAPISLVKRAELQRKTNA